MDNLFPFQITPADSSWRTVLTAVGIMAAVNCALFAVYTLTVFLVIKAVL